MVDRRAESGFTLLEALVAMALLTFVVLHLLGTRTQALIDAAEARNWRVARDIAQHYLSELEAGAREFPPHSGELVDVEGYPDFRYKLLIGEAAIGEAEGELSELATDAPDGYRDRGAWQRERDLLRRAGAHGMSIYEYEDQMHARELEERIPSEDEIEDVAIVVYFPNVRPSDSDTSELSTFVLKAKMSTLAIQGLTPERAERIAEQRGEGSGGTGEGAAEGM